VHGQGPPVVPVHGDPHDGDLAWEALVPHLTDRFTCYLPSVRGRGLSAASPDLSPPRLQEDVTAFIDSIRRMTTKRTPSSAAEPRRLQRRLRIPLPPPVTTERDTDRLRSISVRPGNA
jgi:pimeloyl-ACP methyl ester carboxylesterase